MYKIRVRFLAEAVIFFSPKRRDMFPGPPSLLYKFYRGHCPRLRVGGSLNLTTWLRLMQSSRMHRYLHPHSLHVVMVWCLVTERT